MAFTPTTLTITSWASPVTITENDSIKNLDNAVNDIIDTNAGSVKAHINAELAKIPNYLTTNLNALATEFNTVVVNITAIETVSGSITAVNSLYADIAKLQSLYADKATLDSLFADKTKLDSLYADKATLDSLYADKATLDAIAAQLTGYIKTVSDNITAVQNASLIAGALASLVTNDKTDLVSAVNEVNGIAETASLKNKLINGDFKTNQRAYVSGTATTVANQYTLDRWRVVTLGQALTFSETNGIVTVTAPLDGIEQVIEPLLAGDYSFGMKTGTATVTVSESADNITYTPITPNADGSYTVTGYNYVKVNIKNGTATFAQFEEGSIATPFENRPIGVELALCQRYYNTLVGNEGGGNIFSSYVIAGTQYYLYCSYPVQMRVNPTISISSSSGAGFPANTAIVNLNTVKGVRFQNGTDGSSNGGYFTVNFTADAEL